jgi:hypothetical protein
VGSAGLALLAVPATLGAGDGNDLVQTITQNDPAPFTATGATVSTPPTHLVGATHHSTRPASTSSSSLLRARGHSPAGAGPSQTRSKLRTTSEQPTGSPIERRTAAPPPPQPTPLGPPSATSPVVPAADQCQGSTLPPPLQSFPDASNTGVPPQTSLTGVQGDLHTSDGGQVISGLNISGALVIDHNDVTVTCSRIHGGIINHGARLRVWSSDLGDPSGVGTGAGIKSASYTLRRVQIQGTVDGIRADGDVDVRDTYVHDLFYTSDSGQASGMTHNDTVQITQGSHMVFAHNTFAAWSFHQGQTAGANTWKTPYGDGAGYCTSAIMISNPGTLVSGVVFQDNMIRGRASKYVIVVGPVSGVSIVGNRMGRENRDYPRLFGIATSSPVTVSGNVFYDDGSPANS